MEESSRMAHSKPIGKLARAKSLRQGNCSSKRRRPGSWLCVFTFTP